MLVYLSEILKSNLCKKGTTSEHTELTNNLNVSDVLSEFCGDYVQLGDVDGVAGVGDVVHLDVRHVHPRHLVLEEPESRRRLITMLSPSYYL